MRHSRLSKLLVPTAVAAGVLAVGVAVLSADRGASPSSAQAYAAPAARTTDGTIARAEASLAANPRNVTALTRLASAFLDKASATGDSSWSVRAEATARNALQIDPRSVMAMDTLGILALERHQFAQGLSWSQKSLAIAPTRVSPVSIRADALIELGRYPAAFATVQRRLDLRPDLASYSRASYALELQGRRAEATELMVRAVEAGAPGSREQMAARVELGTLRLGSGDLTGAERDMRQALASFPNDDHTNAALGRVLAARGRLTDAARSFERALSIRPEPDDAIALAEVNDALGRADAAQANRALARGLTAKLVKAPGSNYLDAAQLNAELSRPSADEVERTRRARAARPSVVGDHVLGWVLTRAGRCDEADRAATRSLRLGTRDALMFFHAGMAASCAGNREEARTRFRAALALNPTFSVRWAPVAREELKKLA